MKNAEKYKIQLNNNIYYSAMILLQTKYGVSLIITLLHE